MNTKQLGTDQFISKSVLRHGDKYDYSETQYVNAKTPVTIICKIHGRFQQTAKRHISGQNCPKCAVITRANRSRMTVDEFIERSSVKHNNKFSYDLVDYVTSVIDVTIVCSKHGAFRQTPNAHLTGRGCNQCGKEKTSSTQSKMSSKQYEIEARKVHGDKYSYDLVKFKSLANKILITCPKHGVFTQRARSHLAGDGCNQCGHHRWDTSRFVELSKIAHGDSYLYGNSKCDNSFSAVTIDCKKHGEFTQIAINHVHGHGCPICGVSVCAGLPSSGQLEISEFIVKVSGRELIINDRDIITPREIDIYIPDLKLGVEFHGLYWHSYNSQETIDQKYSHSIKTDLAQLAGVTLLQFFEHEWYNSGDVVRSIISNKLGLSRRVGARNCAIEKINNDEAKAFLDNNHLQGHKYANYHYGLSHDGSLLSLLSISTHLIHQYEVARFANVVGVSVIGGFSRLFKHAVRELNIQRIITYADRRYATGGVYINAGFTPEGVTKPDYFWVKGKSVHNRQQFQKHKLASKLPVFDISKSESQNMFVNGYRRLWGAGNFRFIWRES